MHRRDFLRFTTALATTLPLSVGAETQLRVVGVLMGVAEENPEGIAWLSALREGLGGHGWRDGQNLRLETRWAAADRIRMRDLALDLVAQGCEVVVTQASPATAVWRNVAPKTPNVFTVVVDPVASGFVESFAHPGGGSTGFTNFEPSMGGKWLQLLREIAPKCTAAAIMLNPDTFPGGFGSGLVEAIDRSASSMGMPTIRLRFNGAAEIESGLDALDKTSTGLIVIPDTSTTQFAQAIVRAVERNKMIAIYPYRSFIGLGGLLCYGVDRTDLFRRAASYVDRILHGEKPSDLPVQAPVKFEMAINLKTAKALGISIPPTLLATADEVIE